MANTIALRKVYSTVLDKVYKLSSLTAVLDGNSEYIREGANANEILVPKMDMDGLADYNRNSATGYVDGDAKLEYETIKCEYDRGRKFNIDAMDDVETAGVAFGQLGGEFIRTKVVPELDAWRIAQYCAKVPGGNQVQAAIATGADAIAALRKAKTAVFNAEADIANCVLFIDPAVKGLIDDMQTIDSRRAFEGYANIVEMPANRFNSAVTLTATGAGGFTPAGGAKHINFLIVGKDAAQQYQKHTVSKVIRPEENQSSDGWIFAYRTVGMAAVLDNKANSLYLHTEA